MRPEYKESTNDVSVLKNSDCIAAAPALLLCAATLAVLILDVTVQSMSDAQYMIYPLLIKCVSLISLLCAGICLSRRIRDEQLHTDAGTLCFSGFLLCIAVSTCINGFSRDALMGVQFRYIGVFDILSFFLAYMLCSSMLFGERMKRTILIVLAAVSDLIAAVFLADLFFPFVNAFRNKNEPAAIFYHGNHYGYFLVIAVVISAGLCLSGKKHQRLYAFVSFALNMASLICNRSTGCLLAACSVLLAGVAAVFITDRKKRKGIAAFTAIMALLALIAIKSEPILVEDIMMDLHDATDILSGGGDALHGHGRWGLWQQTVEMIRERPLIGYGCEGISTFLLETNVAANPHNEVMTYAAFFGIPASILYVAGAAFTVIKGLKSHDNDSMTAACAASAYFISSLFGVAMFYTAPFFFVLLGLAHGPNARTEKPEKSI